jgi:hypothetical protein
MSSYSTVPAVVNPEVQPEVRFDDVDEIIAKSQAASVAMDAAYKNLADELAALVNRMHAAMAEIAEATGAFHCERCGEYTLETIELEDYSEELGREVDTYCPRCVPARREVA